MRKKEYDVCDECFKCHWYYLNNDTENECMGQEEKCEEWIKDKYLKDDD